MDHEAKSRQREARIDHASSEQMMAEPEGQTKSPAARGPAGLWYAGGPSVGAPAAIQPKVAIGPSGDAYEREAEGLASQIRAGQNVSAISPLGGGMAQPAEKKDEKKAQKPEQKKEDKKPAQKAAQRAEKKEEKKPEQKKEDKKPAQKAAQRAEKKEEKKPEQKKEDKKPAQKAAQRAEKKEEKKPEQKKEDKKPAQKAAQRAEKKEEKKPTQKKPEPKKDDKKAAQKLDAPDVKMEEPKEPDTVQKSSADPAAGPSSATNREKEGGSRKTPGASQEGTATRSRDMEATAGRAIEQKSPGEPLAPQLRQTLEQRMGVDLGEVKIHRDEASQQATKALGARAFTHGNDIWLGPGESATDLELVAHEVVHVVQQGGGMRRESTAQEGATQQPKAPESQAPGASTDTAAPATQAPAATQAPPIQREALPSASQARAVRAEGTKNPGDERASVQRSMIQRTPPATPPAPSADGEWVDGGTAGRARKVGTGRELRIPILRVPNFKHSYVVTDLINRLGGKLPRRSGEARPDNQSQIWDAAAASSRIDAKIEGKTGGTPPAGTVIYLKSRRSSYYVFGTKEQIKARSLRPYWDKDGGSAAFDVDHKNELQLGGLNTIDNMWLVDHETNSPSGINILNERRDKVRALLAATPSVWAPGPVPSPQHAFANFDIYVDQVNPGLAPTRGHKTYTLQEIKDDAKQIDALEPVPEAERTSAGLSGSDNRVVLYTNQMGGNAYSMRWRPGDTVKNDINVSMGRNIALMSLDIQNLRGTAQAFRQRDNGSTVLVTPRTISFGIGRMSMGTNAYYIDSSLFNRSITQTLRSVNGLSPLEIDRVELVPGQGIVAHGIISASLPIIQGATIDLFIDGDGVRLSKTFSTSDIKIPGPIQITDAALEVFVGTGGVGARGDVNIEIPRVGRGAIHGRADTSNGFALDGEFNFDSNLFDPARIRLKYENDAFSGSGDLGIPAGKVRGINSANIHVEYAAGALTATGTAEPAIPGVTRAGVGFSYSEAEGMAMTGDLELTDIPGIRSGTVHVGLRRTPAGEYSVSASGTAEPAIPGINTSLSIAYEDGALTIEGTAEYARGLASGSITVGATNRPVGEDGRPSGAPTEAFTLYGGGELTLKLAPWLQATAGVKLLPNGELEVHGSIGLPAALDLFPEKRLDKNLLSVNMDIPIVGVAVAGQRIGIFATIGGGLDLSAGIGPGQLQDLHLDVTYNPSHPDDAHVSGAAKLHVPAQAGLRLFVRGALGAGIPIVSATAGLEVGGELGLEGALDASINVDWTPTRGLNIDALGEVSVQPKFKFDITGFVLVEADLLVDTVELYSQRWELASVEYGSDLRFGVKFPLHYQEGQPFDISLSDVEFETPDIDAGSTLRGLISQIA